MSAASIPLWFAILSPLLGVIVGFLGAWLFSRDLRQLKISLYDPAAATSNIQCRVAIPQFDVQSRSCGIRRSMFSAAPKRRAYTVQCSGLEHWTPARERFRS